MANTISSMELVFILLLRYWQKVRSQKLAAAAANLAASKNLTSPVMVK